MKRYLVLLAVVVLFCGCAATKAVPQPHPPKDIDPDQTAAQVWLKLSDLPQPSSLDLDMTARLLELNRTDLVQGAALFDPAEPSGAQLFLLRPAQKKGERLQTALQNRLELVRQTSAAMYGEETDGQNVGCVVAVGNWYALIVPSGLDEERTQQARQALLAAFE